VDRGAGLVPILNSSLPNGQVINGASFALLTGNNYTFAISANNVHGEGP